MVSSVGCGALFHVLVRVYKNVMVFSFSYYWLLYMYLCINKMNKAPKANPSIYGSNEVPCSSINGFVSS